MHLFQQFFGRIELAVDVAVDGHEIEEGVRGLVAHPVQHLVQAVFAPFLHHQAVLERPQLGQHLIADGRAGDRIVADDHHASQLRVEPQGQLDVVGHVVVFEHPGDLAPGGAQGFGLHVVQPAEHDGHAGEQFFAELEQEIHRHVVRGDDDVELLVAELVAVQGVQGGNRVLVVELLGVHVFHLEHDAVRAFGQRLADTLLDVVGPGVPVVVRVQVQHVLARAFLGAQRTGGAGG
ncbi:hypothetical protein DSECCO2_529000 [anaerobic digester metagenome]